MNLFHLETANAFYSFDYLSTDVENKFELLKGRFF